MRYPNAYKGVSQIFTAEIIEILAECWAVIGIILALAGVGAADVTGSEIAGSGLAVSSIIFMIGTAVLLVIAFILNILGISNAAKDEDGFKAAKIAVIVAVLAVVVLIEAAQGERPVTADAGLLELIIDLVCHSM